jgi:anti-sigma regulatory factor (Ser/Thr protein kinase)
MSGTTPTELAIPALTIADLGAIRAFLREALERLDCPGACDAIVLAVDEVCANLAEHGAKDGQAGPVRISVRRAAFDAIITVEDEGPPFDPADAPPPDLESDWADRRVGGLGWFLVRQVVDALTYESTPRSVDDVQVGVRNRLTLIKRDSCRAPHIARD